MDEAIEIVSEVLGAKWIQMYQKLGVGDYRLRFQIQSKWKRKEPTNAKACNKKCALEILQKWRLSVQGKDEAASLNQLLNALNEINGLQKIANDLALRNGIRLHPVVIAGSEASSDEMSSAESTYLSVEILSKKTVIHLEETSHKFAILDISQRLNYDKFVAFSRALGVPDRLIEDIKGANDLHQEQFYHVLKSWIMQDTEKATFSQLIKCLKLCKEDHLIQYLIQRLKH